MALVDGAGLPANQVHVRATWACAACPGSATRSLTLMAGFSLIEPPEGWKIVDGLAYCPRHTVTVKIEHNNLREMPPLETRGLKS